MTDVRAGTARRFVVAAAVAMAALTMSSFTGVMAQQSTPEQTQQSVAQPGQQAPAQFEWVRRCLERGEVNFCEISYGVMMDVTKDARRWITRAGIQEQPGTEHRDLFLFTPLGVRLANGVAFRIDDNKPRKADFSICLDVGCQATTKADDELLAAMKAGNELQIQSVLADGRAATLAVSLSGFTKAYEGPPKDVLRPPEQPAQSDAGASGKGDAPAQ